jgi:hypothetical protein
VSALAKLASAVDSQKPSGGKEAGGAKSWWRWPILIILVLIGIAVAAWVLGRNRRELARLRHEKNKREILAANAKALSDAGMEEKSAEMRLAAANKALERVADINQKIKDAEDEYAEASGRASRITWADLPSGGS